jgi:hypothetical protein
MTTTRLSKQQQGALLKIGAVLAGMGVLRIPEIRANIASPLLQHANGRSERLNSATVHSLHRAGLLETAYSGFWGGSISLLTPAGREAFEALGGASVIAAVAAVTANHKEI